MHTKTRMYLAGILSIGLFGVTAACGSDSSGEAGGDGEQTVRLLFSYQRSIAYIGDLMAAGKGYYADEGLKVEPIPTEGSSFVTQQLAAGNAEYGVTVADAMIVANSQGAKLVSIAQLTHGDVILVSPTDGDVDGLEDLRGKAVGVAELGSGEVPVLESMLAEAGLSDDVEIVAVGAGGPSVTLALKKDKIAAYMGYTNDIAGIESGGAELKGIMPEKYQDLPSNGLVMTDTVLNTDEGRKTAIKIANAYARGVEFASQNPEEALQLACELVPEECQDMDTAKSFFELSLAAGVPLPGLTFGEYDQDKLTTRLAILEDTKVVSGETPVNIDEAFPGKYAKDYASD